MNFESDVGKIYTEFRQPLKHFIGKRISDPSAVEDILHDVFLRIHSRIGTVKEEERLDSWIYAIARNAVIDFYRKSKELVEIPDNIPLEQHVTPDLSDKLANTVRAMIEKLPEKYRQALLLADFEKIKQQDLAAQLGISLPGAKSRVQRARKMLKDLLLACCHFEFDRYGTVFDYHPVDCTGCCHGKNNTHSCSKN